MYCQIDWSRLDRIATYAPAPEELATPAQPVLIGVLLPAGVYHSLTTGARVAIARYSEPVSFHWIEGTRAQQPERVKVMVR